MADITKAVAERSVTFFASSARADPWMKHRFGNHTITFDTNVPAQRDRAIALETEALALNPPLKIETF